MGPRAIREPPASADERQREAELTGRVGPEPRGLETRGTELGLDAGAAELAADLRAHLLARCELDRQPMTCGDAGLSLGRDAGLLGQHEGRPRSSLLEVVRAEGLVGGLDQHQPVSGVVTAQGLGAVGPLRRRLDEFDALRAQLLVSLLAVVDVQTEAVHTTFV